MSRRDRKAREEQLANEQVVGSAAEETSVVEDAAPVETSDANTNNFAQAAERVEAMGVEPIAPIEATTTNKRGVLPDAFGNNVKGERICSGCGIKESETLAKNPRYSFCKGKCVNCYGKTERKTKKPADMTVPELEAKVKYYTDLLAAKLSGAQGLPEGSAIESSTANTDEAAAVASGANVDDLEIAEVSR